MKWFSKLSKLINRNPNILPLKARAFFAVTFMSIGIIYLWGLPRIGLSRTLAACGIVLGIFGAGVLYWETVASVKELQSIDYEFTRMGSSTKLSIGEISVVIAFAMGGFVMAYLQSGAWVLLAKRNPNEVVLYTVLHVCAVFIIYAFPAIGAYGLPNWLHRFCSRWAKRFRVSQDRTAEIKRFLRLIGFASLFCQGSRSFRRHCLAPTEAVVLRSGWE